MGVKGLWRILEPVKQHKYLADLRGQIIAVDLSIWIVEAKTVLPPSVTKPHLRNLFFRVLHLLQLGIVPVIVVEGVPPDLKQGVMRKRLKHRGQNGPPGAPPKKTGRTRFQAVHRECCEMLELLGVPFIQAASEAEAMCAFLNRHHVVDGCITNDGDAFLYGARTVYRNFTMNAKDRHVDMYSMDGVEATLGLDRESLVGLAVLLGCDYLPKGVAGVGREMALRFISCLNGESMLQRPLRPGYKMYYRFDCLNMNPGEANICRRALASPGFPYKEVVDEFLVDKDKLPQQRRLIWKRPKMFKLVNYAFARLEWPEDYTMSKMLPLLTLFDMDALIRSGFPSSQSLRPFRIAKMRTRQGVSCFEVEWYKIDGDPMTTSEYYTTVEEQEMFGIAFPDVVAAFEDERQTRPKERKQKPKKITSPLESDEISELTERFQNLPMLQEPKGKEVKQKHSKNLRTCLPGKISSSPQCLPKHIHTEVTKAVDEFDHLVKSSLRKSKSMASINEKLVCKHQKPPRFVISSDSSDDDCYWLDKSVDTCSSQESIKNAPPSAAVSKTLDNDVLPSVVVSTIQQKQESLEFDIPSEDESDSSSEFYLPLGQRLALKRQGVFNHKSNSRKETKHVCGLSEKALCATNDEPDKIPEANELVISRHAEELACNDSRKISNYLKGLPSNSLHHSGSSEDVEKFNWMPDFSMRKSEKNDDRNSFKMHHSLNLSTEKLGQTRSQKFVENLSDFPKEKIGGADSVESKVELQPVCNTICDLVRKAGSSNQNEDKNEIHNSYSENQLLPSVAAASKLHCITPITSLPPVYPWSVRQYGSFGIETSILNDLDSSHNSTGRESVLYKSTALDDSQLDLFESFVSSATPEFIDVLSKTSEEVVFVDVTSSPIMQSTKGGCHFEALCCEQDERRLACAQTPSIATVSLAERLRLKFGNGTKVETLAHLAPTTIQSSLKGIYDL